MEKWLVKYIEKQIYELVRLTRCTDLLLIALKSKQFLSLDEVNQLANEGDTVVKVHKFYTTLMTRDCYDILIEELGKCKQDGAQKILQNGKLEHEMPMLPKRPRMESDLLRNRRFDQGPEGLQDFLTSKDNKVILISTMDVDVTISKIRESLDLTLVIADNKRHLRALMLKYSSESRKLLVFQWAETPDSDFVAKVVSWTSKGAKAILLTNKGHELLSFENIGAFKTLMDILRWTDLEYWFQEELLERPVEIQLGGERRRVREILKGARAEEELEDEKLILNLINNKTPALFQALPDAFSYYVERKIQSKYVLNKNVIFKKEKNDIFLFTGIDPVKLSFYLSGCNHSSDNSWSQLNQLSVNYIRLEHTDHFDKICELAKRKEYREKWKAIGVHWIDHENGKFFWAKSRNGSMKRIQKATEGMAEENVSSSETEFISLLDNTKRNMGILLF